MAESGFASQGVHYLGFLKAKLGDLRGTASLANELIQNADDAQAKRLWVEVTGQALVVRNDALFKQCDDVYAEACSWEQEGEDRKCCDFHAFRRVASGHKEVEDDTTGAFGIGFISVYQITDRPSLDSGDWHWDLNPEEVDQRRVAYRRLQPRLEETRFTFPWAATQTRLRERLAVPPMDAHAVQRMAEELQDALARAAPFLKHLEYLQLDRPGQAPFVVQCARDETSDEILVDVNGAQQVWLRLRGDLGQTAAQLRARHPQIAAKRKASVTVAVPLGDLPAQGLLYAFLPTEHALGLSLLINADFYPVTDRKRIHFGDDYRGEWNRAALRSAAQVLAQSLPILTRRLSPDTLWALIAQAKAMEEQGRRLKDDTEGLAAFWNALKPLLEQHPCVWTSAEKWCLPNQVRHGLDSDDFRACAPWLAELGVQTVHPSLRDRFNALGAAGVKALDLDVVAAAVSGTGLTVRTALPAAPEWLRVVANRRSLAGLFAHLLQLLAEGKTRRTGEAALRKLALWETQAGDLHPADGLHVAEREVQATLAPAKLGDVWLADASPGPLRHLVGHLDVARAVALLEGVALPTTWVPNAGREAWPLRFVAWVDQRQHELMADAALRSRLTRLPIWPSNQALVPLNGLSVPGDFDDPLQLARLVDSSVAARFHVLLTQVLGASRLGLNQYLLQHVPRTLVGDTLVAPATRMALLRLIDRHISELRDLTAVRDALADLPLIPSRSGHHVAARVAHFPSDIAQLLLGTAAELYVDDAAAADEGLRQAMKWLGVRELPHPQTLLSRIDDLIASKPEHEARDAVRAVFRGMVAAWGQLSRAKGSLVELRSKAWLPGTRSTGWLRANQVYTVFRDYLFKSQVDFLQVERTVQQQAANSPAEGTESLLDFLGIKGEPTCAQVVAHLLHQARQQAEVSEQVYGFLEQNHQDLAIRALQGQPCLQLADGRYVQPGAAVMGLHGFGRFRTALSADWSKCGNLLRALLVPAAPSAAVAVQVLQEMAQDYRDNRQLTEADHAINTYCWTLIASEPGLDLAPLATVRVVANANRFLRVPRDVFFEDRPGLGAKVSPEVQAAAIKRPDGAWPAMERAGVRSLSAVVRRELVDCDGQAPSKTWAATLRDRWALVRRVHGALQEEGSTPCRSEPPEVWEAHRMSLRHAFGELLGPVEACLAFYDDEMDRLYVDSGTGRGTRAAMARELAFVLQADAKAGLLAAALKELLEADSFEDAMLQLNDLGIAEVVMTDGESADDPELQGMGGSDAIDAETPDEAADPTSNEPSSSTGGRAAANEADHVAPDEADGTNRADPSNDGTGTGGRSTGRSGTSGSGHGGSARKPDRGGQLVLRSYVTPPKGDPDANTTDGQGNERQLDVDRRGTEEVMKFERGEGRDPEKKDHFNPGYDIKSKSSDGDVRFIEVKSMSGPWRGFSVGMSPEQVRFAQEKGDQAWLYVVEDLDGEVPKVHPIRDPARRITEFRFDEGWTQAAEAAKLLKRRSILDLRPRQSVNSGDGAEDVESVIEP